MQTFIKRMAVCIICILLGLSTVHVQAAENNLQTDKIPEKHPYFDIMHDYIDSYYGYVSYAWRGGKCIRHTIKNGSFQSKKIPLKGKARKYAKEHESGDACEWTDAKGNFYFLTCKLHKGKYVETLTKVDKRGKLVKRINLNKWLKIIQKKNGSAYHIYRPGGRPGSNCELYG